MRAVSRAQVIHYQVSESKVTSQDECGKMVSQTHRDVELGTNDSPE